MAVVLYHLWPHKITGGFVGVDVFFVISGFLITGHMFRELTHVGGFSLTKFWARRIRRLLPAAFVVLLLSLVGAYLWLPETLWAATARQVGASVLYVQNWTLAGDAVDYSALNADATVAQHYWSLSIEEQFYVAWPLLMVALLWTSKLLSRRFPSLNLPPRRILVAGLSAVALGSLIISVYETSTNPSAAYFITTTRLWEFAAGALTALVFLNRQPTGRLAVLLGWVGLAGIFASATFYDGTTPFPGYTALMPVLGTVLVLCCNPSSSKFSAAWVLSRRPMIFIGDISYAIYLWHWPLIVLAPFVLSAPLGPYTKISILAVSILLSWLTKVSIEDPLRTGSLFRTNGRSFMLAAGIMTVILGLSFGLVSLSNAQQKVDPQFGSSSCYGPGALNSSNSCGPVVGTRAPAPSPANVMNENTNPAFPGCQADATGSEIISCSLGMPQKEADTTVAIVGDSHATAWFPAMDRLGKENGWHVETYTKSSCPLTNALRSVQDDKTPSGQADCTSWAMAVDKTLKSDHSVSAVFTAAYSSAYSFSAPDDRSLSNPAVDGFTTMWDGWESAGKQIVVFDDVPRTLGEYVPTCLALHKKAPESCSVPLAEALPPSMPITKAARTAAAKNVIEIRLQDQFCDSRTCYAQVGSMIVYRDYSHLSFEYSRALAPYIESQLSSLK